MTRSDRLLILALAALALVAWPLAASAGASAERVVITGPAGTSSLPLDKDATVQVEGENGTVSVVIADGTVYVDHADCPDQVCVKTGRVSSTGAVIACVPNRVVLRVEGGEQREFDARIH